MFEILTAEEMKQADAAAIAGGMTGIQLMENAGLGAAENIKRRFDPCPVLVLCGPGNNGGDGFIIAAHLKKKGWPVRVACFAKRTALKGDAALAAKKWDGEFEMLNSNLSLKDTKLIIDAVFGTGFSGALPPEIVTLFDKIRTKNIPVAAIDLPSGVDATTGAVAAGTLQSILTVTFSRKKLAHALLPSKTVCGDLVLSHIGISDEIIASQKAAVFENNPALWLKDFPLPRADSHKFSRGHTVVYGGAKRTGAAYLSAAAAQRIGSGLTSITTRPESWAVYSGYRASIMIDQWQDMDEFKTILRDERKNALVFGPGAGTDTETRASLDAVLTFNKSCVLDADVFTLYKGSPKDLFAKLSARHILTPHEGEFVRIFGDMEGNKIDRARKAAKISNTVVLLKGSDTVIAAPDGTAIVNTNAPATLATGGAGDVLSGMIAGLMAQNMPSFMAAAAATWLHGEAAQAHGLGLTAEDIISLIPQALNKLFRIA